MVAEGAVNTSPKMPGFQAYLRKQIASITNYVRVNFGGMTSSDVSANDVKRVKDKVNFVSLCLGQSDGKRAVAEIYFCSLCQRRHSKQKNKYQFATLKFVSL
jgi:hypothetical protein